MVNQIQEKVCKLITKHRKLHGNDEKSELKQQTRNMLITLLLAACLLPCISKAASPCTLCADPNSTITLPEKEISVPGFPFINSCGLLDSLIGSFYMDDDPLCWTLRNVSSICGCPRPEGGCSLCDGEGTNSTVGNPNLEVPILFQDQFGGLVPTCELFEAYLYNIPETNGTCPLAQDILQDYCGCPTTSQLPDCWNK